MQTKAELLERIIRELRTCGAYMTPEERRKLERARDKIRRELRQKCLER